LWELHLAMEIEHLRIACEMLRDVDGIEAESFLPAGGMAEPLTFEPNKEYVRDVLRRTIEWTSWDAQFVPVTDLPPDHRYFDYQRKVNAGGVPTEQVIDERRAQQGGEYRFATEGAHPIPSLREDGPHDDLAYWRTEAGTSAARVPELQGAK
jgi:hypothetical protein